MKTLFKTPLCLGFLFLCLTSAQATCLLEAPSESKVFLSEKTLGSSDGDLTKEATQEALAQCQKASFSPCEVVHVLDTKFAKDLTKTTRALVVVEGKKAISHPKASDYKNLALKCLATANSQEEIHQALIALKQACEGKEDSEVRCEEKKEEGLVSDLKKIANKISASRCKLAIPSHQIKSQLFTFEAPPAGGSSIHARFLQYKKEKLLLALDKCYQAGMDKCEVESDTCLTKLAKCNFVIKGTQIVRMKTLEEIFNDKNNEIKKCYGLGAQLKESLDPALFACPK